MAQTFRHAVTDGWVFIANNSAESRYPYDWWITQESKYSCPERAAYVQYTKNGVSGQSFWSDGANQYALPENPWPDGDMYISKQSVYDIAYNEYINPPQTDNGGITYGN